MRLNYTGTKSKLSRLLCILSLICIVLPVFSQSDWINPEHKDKRYPGFKVGWYAGFDFGTTLFYGDVALYNNFPKLKDFKQSFGNGYSFYGGKKFRYGLTAEVQIFKGNLKGSKISDNLYPRYFNADILDYSISCKYNLSQELFRSSQQRKFFNRLTLFATFGVGQIFFRSRLYKEIGNHWYLEKANGYKSTGIDSNGAGIIRNKASMISAITLPVGGKINFKLNSVTDIAFDIRYVNVFSDKLDGWERSWSHYDKYLYLAVGLVYNFGQKGEEDVPDSQRFMKHEKKVSDGSADDGGAVVPSKSSRRSRKKSQVDKDLELRLKMYELQLKLFEMQYLTN